MATRATRVWRQARVPPGARGAVVGTAVGAHHGVRRHAAPAPGRAGRGRLRQVLPCRAAGYGPTKIRTLPDLASIRDLARGFTDLVRTRGGDRLTTWVEQAEHATITEIRSFASGLRKDWDAVKAGLTLTWSSGAVEGAVNRIKMLKRQMYGRANPDLLRRRVLLAD